MEIKSQIIEVLEKINEKKCLENIRCFEHILDLLIWVADEVEELTAEEQQRRAFEERMRKEKKEEQERNLKITGLTGKNKRIWDKITQTENLKGIGRYCNSTAMLLIADIYKNSCIGASKAGFYYGFYQGIKYLDNKERVQQKKN